MEISKARLKQIIMEEIQKFMVVEAEDPAVEQAKDEAADAAAKEAEKETDPKAKAEKYRAAADIVDPDEK